MRTIVLTTIGTLGDLHPFIAIALALQRRGCTPILAVAEDQVARVRAAGLRADAVFPGFATICARMGLTEAEATRRIMTDQREMLEQVVLPALSTCADALDRIAERAHAMVASTFVFAAPIIAEQRRIPLINVVLQPMALLSPHDPPSTPDFRLLAHAPVGRMGEWWNRACFGVMRQVMHRRYGKLIDQARAARQLAPVGGRFMFDAGRQATVSLCCYSPQFAPAPIDAADNVRVVGFPIYDGANHPGPPLSPALQAFLDAGPAPIVFTLGSFAVRGAGGFYDEAVRIAERLGRRAVLLTGQDRPDTTTPDIFSCAYARHSALFPRCDVIVHHGGIGTTGQALRAAKPQLVVPHMGDQYDNARRIAQAGVGAVIASHHFNAEDAAPRLSRLIHDPLSRARAHRLGASIAREDGAGAAADAILRAMS